MVDFNRRHQGWEYMDEAAVAGGDLFHALRELELVNRFLGGRRASLKALRLLLGKDQKDLLHILDLGTGAGDIPAAIAIWARGSGLQVKIVAVDFNPFICAWAKEKWAEVAEVEFIQANVFDLPFAENSFDVVHSAMFLHHFSQTEAARLMHTMHALCRRGIIINDLQRHPFAFYSIKWLTRLFSRSAMVRHDAPLSVLRGFSKTDLQGVAAAGPVGRHTICRRWVFRYVLTAWKQSGI